MYTHILLHIAFYVCTIKAGTMYRLTRNKKVRCDLFEVDTDDQARHVYGMLTPEQQRQVSHYNNIASKKDRQKYMARSGAPLRDAIEGAKRSFPDMSDPMSSQIANLQSGANNPRASELSTSLVDTVKARARTKAQEKFAENMGDQAARNRASNDDRNDTQSAEKTLATGTGISAMGAIAAAARGAGAGTPPVPDWIDYPDYPPVNLNPPVAASEGPITMEPIIENETEDFFSLVEGGGAGAGTTPAAVGAGEFATPIAMPVSTNTDAVVPRTLSFTPESAGDAAVEGGAEAGGAQIVGSLGETFGEVAGSSMGAVGSAILGGGAGLLVGMAGVAAEAGEEYGTKKFHEAFNPEGKTLIDEGTARNVGSVGGALAGVGTGIASGFATGGPVGAIVGAIVGAAVGANVGALATETVADVADITYDGIAYNRNEANKTDPYPVPEIPGDPIPDAQAPPESQDFATPESSTTSEVKFTDEDNDDVDDSDDKATSTLRQTYKMATPKQVIAATKAQLISAIQFDMFSHVRPGFGNGERNKLHVLEEARDKVIMGQTPRFTPGEWVGPIGGVEPGPWQWERVMPEKMYEDALNKKKARLDGGRNALACYAKTSASLGILGDDVGYLASVSAKGLKRRAMSVLEPQLRTDFQLQNMQTPTGAQLNRKKMRLGTDNQRNPETLANMDQLMGGATSTRRRSLEVVLY